LLFKKCKDLEKRKRPRPVVDSPPQKLPYTLWRSQLQVGGGVWDIQKLTVVGEV
jgi:hypothetical protein